MDRNYKPTCQSCKSDDRQDSPQSGTPLKPCVEYSEGADKHWAEVMTLAEKYGFILQAYAGTTTLATHKNQIEQLGTAEGLSKLLGRCPRW